MPSPPTSPPPAQPWLDSKHLVSSSQRDALGISSYSQLCYSSADDPQARTSAGSINMHNACDGKGAFVFVAKVADSTWCTEHHGSWAEECPDNHKNNVDKVGGWVIGALSKRSVPSYGTTLDTTGDPSKSSFLFGIPPGGMAATIPYGHSQGNERLVGSYGSYLFSFGSNNEMKIRTELHWANRPSQFEPAHYFASFMCGCSGSTATIGGVCSSEQLADHTCATCWTPSGSCNFAAFPGSNNVLTLEELQVWLLE